MSGKRRFVTIPVDDPKAKSLRVQANDYQGFPRGSSRVVPVPPDDQLTRDLDAVTGHTKYTATVPGFAEAAARLRAAFHLDEEPGLDDVLAHGRARFGLDEGNES